MHDFEMDGIGKRSQMRWKDTEETNTSRAAEKMLLKSELLMKSVNLLLAVDIFIYNPNIGKD